LACGYHDVVVPSFIEVGLLKVASYGDDPMRTGHLELEVSVVGDDDELGIARLTQDGMVGVGEIHYFEGDHFCVEVGSTSECHG
jgi:hypothetical protein